MAGIDIDPSGHDLLVAPTLAALIEARAGVTPDEPMLFDEQDRCLTFAGYADAVEVTARTLRAHGIGPGDTVAWQLPTRIETLVMMGALARLDVTQVPVLPIHREHELRFMLAQTRAGVLAVPGMWRGVDYGALAERVRADLGTFEVLLCSPDPPNPRGTDPAGVGLPPKPGDGDAIRWIYYSSGTTSDPKGVLHCDRAALASGRAMAIAQGYRRGDRYGVAFPFAHVGGLTNLAAVLAAGFALILLEVFDPAQAVEVFAHHDATVVGGGPAFYRAFLEQQRLRPGRPILPRLRFMTGGGAPMPPAMHLQVRAEIGGKGCAHGYGMTETCSIIAMNHPDDTDEHLCNTSGRVVPGMECRIVTAAGHPAPANVEGEIEVRGVQMFAGYLDASLDAGVFDGDWFRTGDLGTIDAEGYLRVTGRLKDIIIRKGENISAKELEDLLYALPGVADVAVVGLPDDERGELVCAVLVMEPGSPPLDLAAVMTYLDGLHLMRQKYPERVEVVRSLPRNSAGKVQKHALVRSLMEPD